MMTLNLQMSLMNQGFMEERMQMKNIKHNLQTLISGAHRDITDGQKQCR